MIQDRVALHPRIAYGKWEAYAKATETNYVTYKDEWIYAPDAVIMCPLFDDGVEQSMADLFSEEVAAAMAKYAPDGAC